MNLSDFNRTDYSGLYLSKEAHPAFGKKYIARFQHNKKRYVKVLGYTKKDNLTKKAAISLLQKFKTSLELDDHIEAKDITINAKTHEVKFDKTIAQLQEENSFLRSVLGEEYRTVDIDVLKMGYKKFMMHKS